MRWPPEATMFKSKLFVRPPCTQPGPLSASVCATTVPASPPSSGGGSSSRFIRPSRPAPAWEWLSRSESSKPTAGRSLSVMNHLAVLRSSSRCRMPLLPPARLPQELMAAHALERRIDVRQCRAFEILLPRRLRNAIHASLKLLAPLAVLRCLEHHPQFILAQQTDRLRMRNDCVIVFLGQGFQRLFRMLQLALHEHGQ